MYNAHSLFLIYFHLSLIFHVFGSAIPHPIINNALDPQQNYIYDNLCPDGAPGRVTQIQEQILSRPAIYTTDCSPSRNGTLNNPNPWEETTLEKRQEQICPADCSNSCSGSGGQSTSDCTTLANSLSSSSGTFTVQPLGSYRKEWGTCSFSVVNMVSSPFIYCDSALASRSQSVVNSCLSQSPGGMCQGSRFQVVVSVNPSAATTTPVQASPTPVPNSGTTDAGSGGNSSNNGGSNGNGSSSAGNGANTSAGGNTNANGATTGSGTGANGATGSSGVISSLSGSQSGGSGGSTTTLSNGSVLVIPTGSLTLPSGDPNAVNAPTGEKTASSTNIPAIVGAILGILILLGLLILLLLWRRKKRAQKQLEALETMSEMPPNSVMEPGSSVEPVPILGFGRAAGGSPMTESGVGVNNVWATSTKARMMAEEAQPRRSGQTDLSSIDPSNYTAITDVSPVPVYRSRSEVARDQRGGRSHHRKPSRGSREQALSPQHTGSNRDAYASDGYSTITGSTGSGSVSARTFAQAAAPNLSPSDIDRLAESIVARMQGRDPAREVIVEEGSSVVDDEPPPPWSPNRASRVP